MKISWENAILIKNRSQWDSVWMLLSEFLDFGPKLGSTDSLLKRIRKAGTFVRQPGSGRPRSARSDKNMSRQFPCTE